MRRRNVGRILLQRTAPGLVGAALLFVALAVWTTPRQPDAASAADLTGAEHLFSPSAHQSDQGLGLISDLSQETVAAGAPCPAAARVRAYTVATINVEVTLNRYLDYDPEGRMYVLEDDLPRVRQEEAANRTARAGQGEPAVSIGEQGDAIQPLTLRVNQGECLQVSLRNALSGGAPVSFHLHGSALRVAADGAPALASNPEAFAAPGESVTYAWWVAPDEPEGTHLFHSHGDTREQTSHGLFGAVVVEPTGSRFLDPRTGAEARTGWDAIIADPQSGPFREFALYYHEIGHESYLYRNGRGEFIVQIDPYTGSYRPGARALNYRSEPFMNRLELQQQLGGSYDKSAAYSSYTFGDPATPLLRSYLGDPVKQRLIDGGSEVFHVHHVHGGATRWPRDAGASTGALQTGLLKHPPLILEGAERVDAQSTGPAETYDIVNECGSGGCQQSAGDFLIHCHIAEHYLSGMWTVWRVYNTLQDGVASLDGRPPLLELSSRAGRMQHAVTSDQLIGHTMDWMGQTFPITAENVAPWVERQLPPAGMPRGYDAAVFDWVKQGDRYLNEPETDRSWPGYTSVAPGQRPPILFDPATGKLAYPWLRPHLGKRPPFAPNHGPAPFLEPIQPGTAPAAPGANGPWSLCPTGTTAKRFTIHAIQVPITLNPLTRQIDPVGQLFVLRDDEEAVRANNDLRTPLAIRANAGEDCVDLILKSELSDSRDNGFLSKVNVHIHFTQFDVQASDGVNTGFNYEQSVRPYTSEGEKLGAATSPGATRLQLGKADRFQAGAVVGVGMEQNTTFETARIAAVSGDTLTLDAPLQFAHRAGEIVSSEFVRYRWYPDVQFGTAYFHDHVDALHSWAHGLFGALVVEPPGSTYSDPHSGAALESGPIADVHTLGRVSADVVGSFRELVSFLQDGNPRTQISLSSGSTFNLRAEPPLRRGGDPADFFSSRIHGDPATPVLEARVGDPVVFRSLVAGTNEVHTFHVDGHWFRAEPYNPTSPPTDTAHLGISERYDLVLPRAGGPVGYPGDYLYYGGRASKLQEGSWGILRVLGGGTGELQMLPGRGASPPPASVCPPDAPRKRFAVAALQVPLPMLGGQPGLLYALDADREATLSGDRPPQPLVLHVNVGDCIEVDLQNETSGPVSFHAGLLAADPADSGGVNAGNNPPQTVASGAARRSTFYAVPEVGETTALVRDWGNVLANPRLGLYGAIVVGPSGATYTDPTTGADLAQAASWQADVQPPNGTPYRDFTLLLQDEDQVIGTAQMPYTTAVGGAVALNYRAEPLAPRLARDRDPAHRFMSAVHGDPATPLLRAFVGDPVHIHVLAPASEQGHVYGVEGHRYRWPPTPGGAGGSLRADQQIGALDVVTLMLDGGAGGPEGLPGDYLYGDHREPYREAGLWGTFRVYPPDAAAPILPLTR
jgi:FtsP/CotA-like multicopper oxidase with cupredoxin domain